jgi:hypothetical protein
MKDQANSIHSHRRKIMTSTHLQPQADTFAKPGIGEWLGRLLCWFAAFPYVAYTQISTPSTRVWVLSRGLAVIISPLVFTLALISNGTRFIGHTPYLYLLPPVVFSIDWFLIASAYTLANSSGWLRLVRIVFFLISGSMALFAGVLSESENLLKGLHRSEDAVTLQGAVAQNLVARMRAIDEQIARNEQELMTRDAVDAERLEARRLEHLECFGMSGVDPKTGIHIKGGGKCLDRAATYRINAETAEKRLEKLSRLEQENQGLAEQRGKLNGDLDTLLQKQRSPDDSMGSLLRALNEADAGLWVRIMVLFLCVIMTEAFAFIMSEIAVTQTLQTAVQFSEEIDRTRLQAWRDAELAQAARQRAARRAQAADGLAPLEVKLTPVSRKSDVGSERPPVAHKTEDKPLEFV